MNVQIDAGPFEQAARRLERANLRPALQRAIEAGASDAAGDVRAAADRLPARGGLAAQVARTRITAKSTGGRFRGPGVRLVAEPGAVKDPRSVDRGRLLHPVFGNLNGQRSVVQLVRRGWFSEPVREQAPAIRRRIETELAAELRRVGRQ